jgi:prophage antirepressor-like protein
MHAELFTFTPFASSGDGFNLSATVKDGEPWFIASQVCRSLGIKNAAQAMNRLDDDEKGLYKYMTSGGTQEGYMVSESGLYALVCGSNKESARRFRKWITSVVLPSIRKHGGYINGLEALSQEAQAEIIPQVHALAQRTQEQAQEERDARHGAFQIMKSFGRKRVRRPPTNR